MAKKYNIGMLNNDKMYLENIKQNVYFKQCFLFVFFLGGVGGGRGVPIRSTSRRSFQWVPSTYDFGEKQEKHSLESPLIWYHELWYNYVHVHT